ncbi:sugar ABC transporter ATP-binding protein, partial [bacterium]|nr:sugar ABC transporter ATP-binding protein [bacterium]
MTPVPGDSLATSVKILSPMVEAVGVSKQFYGVKALQNVSVEIYPGEVLAIIGENGAGKSTLMKLLAGVYQPDSGQIRIHGKPVDLSNPSDAISQGIALIHQELNLADNLTVSDNLF